MPLRRRYCDFSLDRGAKIAVAVSAITGGAMALIYTTAAMMQHFDDNSDMLGLSLAYAVSSILVVGIPSIAVMEFIFVLLRLPTPASMGFALLEKLTPPPPLLPDVNDTLCSRRKATKNAAITFSAVMAVISGVIIGYKSSPLFWDVCAVAVHVKDSLFSGQAFGAVALVVATSIMAAMIVFSLMLFAIAHAINYFHPRSSGTSTLSALRVSLLIEDGDAAGSARPSVDSVRDAAVAFLAASETSQNAAFGTVKKPAGMTVAVRSAGATAAFPGASVAPAVQAQLALLGSARVSSSDRASMTSIRSAHF